MATLLGIQRFYKYGLQDLGSLLEQINDPATSDVMAAAITEAVNHFSRRYPRVRTVLQSPLTPGFYPLPTDWQDYSDIKLVEFPIDQLPPAFLPERALGYVPRETGTVFFLNPNPAGPFRYSYTTVHGGGADSVGSIRTDHEAIVGKMAAAEATLMFAARYANTVKANVDSVEYRTKEQEFRAVHDALVKSVDEELRRQEWALQDSLDQNNRYDKGWR